MEQSLVQQAFIVSGMPHILLAPQLSPGWQRLAEAYAAARAEIIRQEADLILYCSTQWLSILGYMFQADPEPQWDHVDQNWHELGTMPYRFRIDTDFAASYAEQVAAMGYKTRLVAYRGFPIDTGTIVAQKLLNPDNRLPAAMVSCNMYSEKQETTRLGQAAARALQRSGKKAVVVLVSSLSHRFHVQPIDPQQDHIASRKDDEWNRKIVEMLADGQLENVAQTAREFARQAHSDQKMKGIWWLNGLLGQSNDFRGQVFGYEPVWGTGAVVIGLQPTRPIQARAFDPNAEGEEGSQAALVEELTDFERSTLRAASAQPSQTPAPLVAHTNQSQLPDYEIVDPSSAEPVGPYPHARRYGNLLFLSGIGPRKMGSSEIPGVTFDAERRVIAYDIREQTRSVIANIQAILEHAGSSLDKVIDIQVFLTNMAQDFKAYNEVYNEAFARIRPTRTTVEVGALPTPIAIEFKVIARP